MIPRFHRLRPIGKSRECSRGQTWPSNAQPIPIARRIGFLVALPPVRDLLLFAKHLFVAAMVAIGLAADSEAVLMARLVLPLAPSNKFLAETNKSQDRVRATKRYIGLKVMCEKQRTSTFSHHRRVKGPSLIRSAN